MKDARILCVDDEPNVLEGLGRILHRKCVVLTASCGAAALELMAISEPIHVIVSDMRMPEMSGATLLAKCCKHYPDTVRLLLTGYSGLESAVQAVNEGQIFRFLTKPCPPQLFLETLQAAVDKYRQDSKGRILIEQSVVGSIRALAEVIALVHPGTLASTSRQLERARKVASYLHVREPWHVEVAAILAQAGYVVLPNNVLAKVSEPPSGKPNDAGMLTRVPLVLSRVLSGIPCLGDAQTAMRFRHRPFACDDGGPEQEALPIGSRILKALTDLASEETRTASIGAALAALRSRPGQYDPSVLDAIAAVCAVRTLRSQAPDPGSPGVSK